MGRHFQSIGKDLSNYSFNALIIIYPISCSFNYVYEGLMPTDRSIIDVASGGALVDKTPEVACQLILNMAAKSKHFGTHGDFPNKQVNEVSISNFENKVNNLTSLVCSLACGNVQQVKVCSTCSLLRICAQQCKKITLNKLMQLMENSMDNPNVSMIPFTTRTIPD